MAAAQHAWRTARRSWRGWRAPRACETIGATAVTTPRPNRYTARYMWNANEPAASDCGPSQLIIRVSVVFSEICANCATINGQASDKVARASSAHGPRNAARDLPILNAMSKRALSPATRPALHAINRAVGRSGPGGGMRPPKLRLDDVGRGQARASILVLGFVVVNEDVGSNPFLLIPEIHPSMSKR